MATGNALNGKPHAGNPHKTQFHWQATISALAAMTLAAAPATAQTADATYTWPSVGSEIAVVYDTTDTTKVKSITATVEAGKTVTLTGGTIDFAADAVVKLAGYGNFVVNNTLTGVNGLTVTNTAAKSGLLSYKGQLPANGYATVFPGCDLDDITVLYADNPHSGYSWSNSGQIHWPYVVRRFTENGVKTMTLQMQIQYPYASLSGYLTKCVKIELKQSGADVVVKEAGEYGCFNNVEGTDMELSYQRNPGRQDIADLRVWRAANNYHIGALAAEWNGAAHMSLRGSLTGLGGKLTVARGALVDTLGATVASGPAQLDVLGTFTSGDATGTANGIVAGTRGGTIVYAATQPGNWTVTLNKANNMGNSFDRLSATDYAGHLVVKGDSAKGAYMTCDIAATNVVPKSGTVDIYDGGTVNFTPGAKNHSGTLYHNDTATYYVHSGGVLRISGNHAIYRNDKIKLLGGTFEKRRESSTANTSVMNLYCNDLFLADGAQVNGDPEYPNLKMWMGNAAGTWSVRGSSPSFCNVVVQFVGTVTHTIDVGDVTSDDQPDFIYTKALGTQESNKGATVIKKVGEGTVLCKSDVDIVGGLNIANGTWQLGASNIWKNNRALTLTGGTLSVSNNTENAIGTLTVGASGGTIELGEGATLNFADSHLKSWEGTLVIKGFRPNAIRFGTSNSALTDAQLRRLRKDTGGKLGMMSNGYLAQYGVTIVVN